MLLLILFRKIIAKTYAGHSSLFSSSSLDRFLVFLHAFAAFGADSNCFQRQIP